MAMLAPTRMYAASRLHRNPRKSETLGFTRLLCLVVSRAQTLSAVLTALDISKIQREGTTGCPHNDDGGSRGVLTSMIE
ncbi:hypothetical protein BZA05DRAFT_408299 [Tricharina praecox]|uniref:uncharacterized protein n=1 Tax=Tricharina praecox TaxID=43433 RepID=UPI00221E44DE|nr:uncharacterized protein BZA05DRAFT_408299 [Tricharina praecox]KAI5845373.1 hypothetical protein BZA05DRAFT_408299 [Tricharina praecox]